MKYWLVTKLFVFSQVFVGFIKVILKFVIKGIESNQIAIGKDIYKYQIISTMT